MYAIEVRLTDTEWRRMQARYKTKEAARSWLGFVKSAWHVRHARVVCVSEGGGK
jgi:hypothetical protein